MAAEPRSLDTLLQYVTVIATLCSALLVEHPEVDGQTIAICPSRIWIEAAGPL
ncbi:MAG TPA: hypothetical protein VNG12_19745 [Acidimicrobiales bacterium]|nr:hypothetical protein [Acidimicrobiales bacterium]